MVVVKGWKNDLTVTLTRQWYCQQHLGHPFFRVRKDQARPFQQFL